MLLLKSLVFAVLVLSSSTLVSGWFLKPKYIKKCYAHIGCFSNEPPYHKTALLLPQSPGHMKIKFHLFTRRNPEKLHLLNPYKLKTITQSTFDGSKESIFIIHGYLGDGSSPRQQNMKTEFLKKDDLNVIVVDWKRGADSKIYYQSAANTRVVGATIAQLIRVLVSSGSSSYDKFTLVGHSLGAHVAGYAGSYLGGSIARIYGLDPAGPGFERADPEARLDPTDAQYVEAIHTDQESLIEFGFGLEKAVGDADFYPNGGENQPGCNRSVRKSFLRLFKGRRSGLIKKITCSHSRARELFTESINSNCLFTGVPCSSMKNFESGQCLVCGSAGCADMGYNAKKRGQGRYYFDTAAVSPYCLGKQ